MVVLVQVVAPDIDALRFQEVNSPHDLWDTAGCSHELGFGGGHGVQSLCLGRCIKGASPHRDGETGVALEIVMDSKSSVNPVLHNGEVLDAQY